MSLRYIKKKHAIQNHAKNNLGDERNCDPRNYAYFCTYGHLRLLEQKIVFWFQNKNVKWNDAKYLFRRETKNVMLK
jgi:hypothetical protein